MTTLQAIDLAAHIYGGMLTCSVCETSDFDRFMEGKSDDQYDDLEFGKWLLAEGWKFDYHEFDYVGGPGSGKFGFYFVGIRAVFAKVVVLDFFVGVPKVQVRSGRAITSRCSGPAPASGSLKPVGPPAGPGH